MVIILYVEKVVCLAVSAEANLDRREKYTLKIIAWNDEWWYGALK